MMDTALILIVLSLSMLLCFTVPHYLRRGAREQVELNKLATQHQLPHVMADGSLIWFAADGGRLRLLPDGTMLLLDVPETTAPVKLLPVVSVPPVQINADWEQVSSAVKAIRQATGNGKSGIPREVSAEIATTPPTLAPQWPRWADLVYRSPEPPDALNAVIDALQARPSDLTDPAALEELRRAAESE